MEYVRAYSQPGALRGAFNDYRAGLEDVVQDEEDEGVLIECPTLVLWGEDFALGGKMWDFRLIGKRWRDYRSSRCPVRPLTRGLFVLTDCLGHCQMVRHDRFNISDEIL